MTMKNYKLIWFGIFCCLQPLILFAQRGETIRKAFLDPKSDQVLVVAHRGNWRSAPENSVAAIDSAIQMGVDIVEIDIHKTKDGQLILMHDDRVDRTTNGKGLIKDYTLAEIKKLKLKDKDGNLTEHIVPTLEEALLAGKGQIMFNLDKAYSVFDEVYAVLEKTGTASLVIMKGWRKEGQGLYDTAASCCLRIGLFGFFQSFASKSEIDYSGKESDLVQYVVGFSCGRA